MGYSNLRRGFPESPIDMMNAVTAVQTCSISKFRSQTPFMSPLTLRQQLRPSRSVTSHPQRPVLSVAHASVTFCNTRHRLSPVLARNMPLASSSLASAPSLTKKSKKPRAPGTQKPREKLLTFQRHTADFPTTKHQPLCSAITINTS